MARVVVAGGSIAGLAAGLFDVLNVDGNVFTPVTGFDIALSFLGGFTPQLGDRWDFLNVTGASGDLTSNPINAVVTGLAPGYAFDFNFSAPGVFGAEVVSVAPVPLPAAMPLFLGTLGLLGVLGVRRRRSTSES